MTKLKRKSFFMDDVEHRRAKKALGAKTDSEVIRLSAKQMADKFWKFMKKTCLSLKPESLEKA